MSVLLEPVKAYAGGYRHEAFLYSGTGEFLAGTMPLISRQSMPVTRYLSS